MTVDARDREEPQEPELEALVPDDIRVESVRALPARLTRMVGVGDLALRAMPQLLWRVWRVVRAQRSDVIVLIVPPWYLLFLARPLRLLTGRPIVVDYVDPWIVATSHTLKSRLAQRIAAWCEGYCLGGVAGVFAVSAEIVRHVEAVYPPMAQRPSASSPYGFDAADLTLRAPDTGDRRIPGVFRLVYVGALSDSTLHVMAALLDALAAGPSTVRLELYGTTYAPVARAWPRVSEMVAARGLGDRVVEHPARIPYADALAVSASADALLMIGDLTRYYAASKLMPTLAARRPILAVLHAATEPATLLRSLDARGLVLYGDEATPTPTDAVPRIGAVMADLLAGRVPPLDIDVMTDPTLRPRTAVGMTGVLAQVLDQVRRA